MSFSSVMIQNWRLVLCLVLLPGVLCNRTDLLKIKLIPEPIGDGWYRHWFTYGDIDIEDEQVGVGTGYVFYAGETTRYFNFSYPGPNKMRNIITYVEGEFITDTNYVEVSKTDGSLWERFIRFQVYAKKFHYFNFRFVAWAIWKIRRNS